MMITLSHITRMPNNPYTFEFLDRESLPLYSVANTRTTKFKLPGDSFIHSATHQGPRARRMELNSSHLILSGLFDSKQFHDSLQTPLEIEVYSHSLIVDS